MSANTTLAPPARANYSPPPRRPGVLAAIADGEERIALGLRLEGAGFAVWTAADGLRAFDTFLRHTGEIDVLLLDAELPDLSAPEFLRRLRANFPGIPCALLAREPDEPTVREVRRMGAAVIAGAVTDLDLFQVLHDLAASDAGVTGVVS
jgi:CheY-like chemotaxis protein